MKIRKILIAFVAMMIFTLGVQAEKLDFDEVSVHDPSIIKVDDTYYVFGSHVSVAKSDDLKNWTYIANNTVGNNTLLGHIKTNLAPVFEWAGNGDTTDVGAMGIWAPDVYYSDAYINDDGSKGAFLMYFSLSTGQDEPGVEHMRSLIGLAVSKNVSGPYEYKDTIIYTGFRNQEADKGYWVNTDFNEVFPGSTPTDRYFRENGTYNFDLYPNAIDPTIVDTHDGKVYMTYGSWNGGVWMLQLDPETGLVINRPSSYNDGVVVDNDRADAYFGQKIFGGFWQTGEGPYIQYHQKTGYYHLYMTYGTLDQAGTYNMRFFRSKDILGPYLDINGNDAYLETNSDINRRGNKILGSFDFSAFQTIAENASFFSYRVPGHNSVYYDDESGLDYLVFHTRFKEKGEGHEVRVHQILFNDAGWPLIPLQRYSGETIQKDIDVSGHYIMVNQWTDTSPISKPSFVVTLEKDGSVVWAHKGSWSFEGDVLSVTLGRDTYTGFVLNQSTPLTNWEEDLTLTLLNDEGVSVLGARLGQYSSDALLDLAYENLELGRRTGIVTNLNLPSQITGGVSVHWSSSNKDVISAKGVVTQQNGKEKVTLTATLKYAGLEKTKSFDLETAPLIESSDFNVIPIVILIVGASFGFVIYKKRKNKG